MGEKMILQHYFLVRENYYYPSIRTGECKLWSSLLMLLVCGPHCELQDLRSSLTHAPAMRLWISPPRTLYLSLRCTTPPLAGLLTWSA